MNVHGRSILDVAHAIAAEGHAALVAELDERGADNLIALLGDQFDPQIEGATSIASEAFELLHGPRPDYAEIAGWLDLASRALGGVKTDAHYRARSELVELRCVVIKHLAIALEEAARRLAVDEAGTNPRLVDGIREAGFEALGRIQ